MKLFFKLLIPVVAATAVFFACAKNEVGVTPNSKEALSSQIFPQNQELLTSFVSKYGKNGGAK